MTADWGAGAPPLLRTERTSDLCLRNALSKLDTVSSWRLPIQVDTTSRTLVPRYGLKKISQEYADHELKVELHVKAFQLVAMRTGDAPLPLTLARPASPWLQT